jgi:hypothetical protein
MPTHNSDDLGHEPEQDGREQPDAFKGYEVSDARVSGVVVFLVAMSIFVVVAGFVAFGVGKVLNARMANEDGPRSKWAQPVDVRPLGNMPTSPALQNKLAELTERFPTPRVQTDDGNQDVADLHAREDLLLDNYSWADQAQGKVRIPIERAMELIAQRGLPLAPAVKETPLMTGDKKPEVASPLTNGFARTGYELDQAAATASGAGEHK